MDINANLEYPYQNHKAPAGYDLPILHNLKMWVSSVLLSSSGKSQILAGPFASVGSDRHRLLFPKGDDPSWVPLMSVSLNHAGHLVCLVAAVKKPNSIFPYVVRVVRHPKNSSEGGGGGGDPAREGQHNVKEVVVERKKKDQQFSTATEKKEATSKVNGATSPLSSLQPIQLDTSPAF
ncbi:hypothetical protein CPB84DRAFT_1751069 [Gymnopilus junonius]|uniref:Uncharacterized protein n=1 Tax=Gymnopilus junonius TaxID=109634 RepID=A0A9P5NF53_GYMJU|nr:hypothetical protein CPB84DRAFT_1751069 [Gymnopilus junonius]